MNSFPVNLSLPVAADPTRGSQTFQEIQHGHPRIIGGDKGDILFDGYSVEGGMTFLSSPVLRTSLDISPSLAQSIAEEVMLEAYQSIGTDCLY